jgi:hypothetical protein
LTQGQIFLRQDGEKRLIDRPRAEIGEECSASIVGDPGITIFRRRRLAVAVAERRRIQRGEISRKGRVAVGEDKRGVAVREESGDDILQSFMHRIGGGHGRERNENALAAPLGHQARGKP